MKNQDRSKLKRDKIAMPEFVQQALTDKKLMTTYLHRPAYQQNDYMWWISSPKREATKQKRLTQMLDELKQGNVYMKMKWNGDKIV